MTFARIKLLGVLFLMSLGGTLWAQGFDKGRDAYNKRDFATAMRELRPLAEQGDARAQTLLGQMYSEGFKLGNDTLERDEAKAAQWTRRAAEQGHPQAQFNLGKMYDGGHGVSMDHAEAARWTLRAAEQGHTLAQHSIGVNFLVGQGVPEDGAEAAKWLRRAAEKGYPIAQRQLGELLARGDDGIPQDEVEALGWLGLYALQTGRDPAHFRLGVRYEHDPTDFVRAYMFYAISKANGFEYATEAIDSVSEKMATAEISKAQAMARDCLHSNYIDCGWRTPSTLEK
ncbi:sel1 repeat family protein [Roseovarius sp. A21]|uniref:Sel1 repeat family protein n=1 Tax=Roseovarius bejariae TaxID=2576383 RepID=A0A844CX99_9RHOB|nr:tetratricopeptide repeat protein [Roseovarius bejariae]MRU14253.1 sel1 repeat family protein [Roseovarius bejariae]